MPSPNQPHSIALETPDFVIRTLETGDASEAWRDWLADPETARMLNAKREELSVDAVRKYIASFDRMRAHLLGIFEKRTGRLVGIRAVYVDARHSAFLVNVLVGDKDARGKGARRQSRVAVYRYFFEVMNLATAHATVVADNAIVLAGMAKRGWIEDGVENRMNASGIGHVEIRKFRLPRDVWQRLAPTWTAT